MNAQRCVSLIDGTEKYHVGSSFIAFITKEEYEEILAEVGKEVHIRDNAYIVYMRDCSKETLSKWANYVLNSSFHKDKKLETYDLQIAELERKLKDIKFERNKVQELVDYTI